MAKVVVASLNVKRKSGSGAGQNGAAIGEKRVRDSDGQIKTLRTLDARSPTFGEDLRYVFGKNVAKARRENKRITGFTDLAPAKG